MVNYLDIRKQEFKTVSEVQDYLVKEDVHDTRVFPVNRLKWDCGGTLYSPEGEYKLTQYSFKDVLNLGGLPMKTSEKFFEKRLDQNVCELTNKYIRQLDDEKQCKIIFDKDLAYGIVGKQYHLIPHKKLFDRFLNSMPTTQFELIRGQADPQSMRLDFCDKNAKIMAMPGDELWPGFSIGNSERKKEAINIREFLWRLVCSNGAISRSFSEDVGHFIHRGRMSDYYGDEFRNTLDTIVGQFGDVRNALIESTDKMIDDIQFVRIKARLDEEVGKRRTNFMFEKIMDKNTEMLLPGVKLTRYDMGNMITEYAHQLSGVEQSFALERLGGEILLQRN